MQENIRGGSPARLEQRATRMVRDALAGYLGDDAVRHFRYEARLILPEGETEPQLHVRLQHDDVGLLPPQPVDLRQVFAGATLRGLVDAAVRASLLQAGFLKAEGGWATHPPHATGDGAADGSQP